MSSALQQACSMFVCLLVGILKMLPLCPSLLLLQYAAFEDNDKVYLLQEYAEGVSEQRAGLYLLLYVSVLNS
jgi:hypothetical protein